MSKGFTLIELLVVIAIIGLLSSTLMVSLGTVRGKARDTRRNTDINQIFTALELYYSDHSHYPCVAGAYQDSNDPDFMSKLVDGGYLDNTPADPVNNDIFFYEYGSFSNEVGGACGQVIYLGIYTERVITDDDCPHGGQAMSSHHCHIFYPKPPNCPNPYTSVDVSGSPCNQLID